MENGKQSAYPSSVDNAIRQGLTKREYIATKLLAAILSNYGHAKQLHNYKEASQVALTHCDELLKQFEK